MLQVGGQNMLQYELLLLIERMLEETSSAHKQEVVIHAMVQVIPCTNGWVIEPYNYRLPKFIINSHAVEII